MSDAPFARHGDVVTLRLHPVELDALRLLLADLGRTLAGGDADDPVLRRLAPDPAPTDAELSRELRELVGAGVADDRRHAVDEVTALLARSRRDGDRVEVDLVDDEPWRLLGVLNDLRLAIGARVEITDLDRTSLGPEDERRRAVAAMDHFGWWQWHLVALLDPESAEAAASAEDADREPGTDPDEDRDGDDGDGRPPRRG